MEVRTIIRMREGGHVKRCHCFPHHGHYDVAQHTFHMLLLLDALHPDPPRELYTAILRHDLLERWTGDSPAAIKRISVGFAQALKVVEKKVESLSEIDRKDVESSWIKALDNLEFFMWCDDQIALGNRVAEDKKMEVDLWFRQNWPALPAEVQEFLEEYRWERTKDDFRRE